MEGLLLRIKMIMNENTELLVKRLEKLDTKFEALSARVRNLERRKPKVIKPKENLVKYVLTACNLFRDYDMSGWEAEINTMKYTDAKKLSRLNPFVFQKIVRQLFKKKEHCNVHLKGTRIYQYKNKTWVHVNCQKGFLDECRKNLWMGFNEMCQHVLYEHTAWEKVYKPIIYKNIARVCPISNTGFRDLLSKCSKQAQINRKLFK